MTLANRLRQIRSEFEGLWGPADALVVAQAPGRVNLIGEHTDYNDGYVLPMAIDLNIIIAGRPNGRKVARVYSSDLNSSVEFHTRKLEIGGLPVWARYLIGAARRVMGPGEEMPGFDAVIQSTLPIGASLSSSAAFTIAGSLFIGEIAGVPLTRKGVALACQQVEHEDIGVRCGIMDQMVILNAREDNALLIDCRSLLYEWVPLHLREHTICVCDTGVKHALARTAYNQRRSECDAAARHFAKRLPGVRALRDVTIEELKAEGAGLTPTVLKRARHVISENRRVVESIDALRKGDLARFGGLMNESHDSLRTDYDVSSAELNTLVDAARSVDGTLGARLTGAGFGGCTVNLLRADAITAFTETVSEKCADAFGHTPKIYISRARRGARVLTYDGEYPQEGGDFQG
ncbi:MAG: galactokinase [Planctomycetota bacterium]